jgi:anti-sigma regulatory factor (Ser/Thr protein kinase)
MSRPPPAVEVERWTLGAVTELQDLRHALRDVLGERVDGTDVADRVSLVATELAGNALLHGLPPVEVRLLAASGRWVIEVADHDPAHAPHLAEAGQRRVGGRGLLIARAVSTAIGWYRDGPAKRVWAALPHGHHPGAGPAPE